MPVCVRPRTRPGGRQCGGLVPEVALWPLPAGNCLQLVLGPSRGPAQLPCLSRQDTWARVCHPGPGTLGSEVASMAGSLLPHGALS